MKKIIAVFFLLICGLFVLLATVDLEPYLSQNQADIPEKIFLPPVPGTDDPPIQTDATDQAEPQATVILVQEHTFSQPEDTQQGALSENSTLVTTEDVITTGPDQTATPPSTKLNAVAELGEISSSLIEMEVTILPVGEYPFSILLETFLKQETAQQAIFTYQERGITAYWVKVKLGKEIIRYRLFTGVFSTESEAQLYLEQHQLAGKLIRPTYYSSRLGVYQNKLQLINDFIKARNAGVIPYILSTKKGEYYLYVGAFYTYIGATSQCRYLAETGLNCKPVRRSTIP